MLAQEPWCYTPEQIARLTDWQIEHLYARPAAERAKEMQSHTGPVLPGAVPAADPRRAVDNKPDYEPGTIEHRNQCVSAFMQVQGLSRDRAVAQYERQLAQWKAEQQGGG